MWSDKQAQVEEGARRLKVTADMNQDKEQPTLRIYIAQHCETCVEAQRLAAEVRLKFASIKLELIDLDEAGSQNPDDVFSVPTYVLNGRIIWLGNPSPAELFSHLAQVLE